MLHGCDYPDTVPSQTTGYNYTGYDIPPDTATPDRYADTAYTRIRLHRTWLQIRLHRIQLPDDYTGYQLTAGYSYTRIHFRIRHARYDCTRIHCTDTTIYLLATWLHPIQLHRIHFIGHLVLADFIYRAPVLAPVISASLALVTVVWVKVATALGESSFD